ncbi:MAG: DUF4097 family beta strand repeat-containing protein [Erysipelotrichaceae bacterium]|nr:DUF4097 family beta strand repeat-containing protein [Erysipelotrichaceae bacterium]
MKKKYQYCLIAIVLMVFGFVVGYFIRDFRQNSNTPIAVINKSQTMEIYEEFSVANILEIQMDTVNVNLKVLPSQDQNIHVLYRPSVDLAEHAYYIENKIMYLHVDKIETSSSMVASEEEMIYLYLPKQTNVTLTFKTETGYVDIDGVGLRNLKIQSQNGIVSISHSTVDLDATIETVAGKVVIKDMAFDYLKVKTNTALISCFMMDTKENYDVTFNTQDGKVYVNTEQVANSYQMTGSAKKKSQIELESHMGDIRVRMKDQDTNE